MTSGHLETPETSPEDRRQHRRLAIRLPVECSTSREGQTRTLKAITANICTGGLYLEVDMGNGSSGFPWDGALDVEVIVPPGEGYFPYESRVRNVAQVLRREPLPASSDSPEACTRMGIAACFKEPFQLSF